MILLRYYNAACCHKLKRRFPRCNAIDQEPHFLHVLRSLTKKGFAVIPFDTIIVASGLGVLAKDHKAWAQFGCLTTRERAMVENPSTSVIGQQSWRSMLEMP